MNQIYQKAKQFLIDKIPASDAEEILDSYLTLPDGSNNHLTINEIFFRLLGSAQNSNMKAGVIGGSIDGIHNLGKALYNFDPKKIHQEFSNKPNELLDHIITTLNPRGQIRDTPKSLWPKFSRTIISTAAFLDQFDTSDDFYNWANHLYQDRRSMAALPMILAAEIDGIGYPLACDFLKELGFINYGKPDVHIIDIFSGIGLCDSKASPYQIQKIITEIADSAQVSPYNVDKLFWLIGSGKFYNHPNIGMIGRKKEEFIAELMT